MRISVFLQSCSFGNIIIGGNEADTLGKDQGLNAIYDVLDRVHTTTYKELWKLGQIQKKGGLSCPLIFFAIIRSSNLQEQFLTWWKRGF